MSNLSHQKSRDDDRCNPHSFVRGLYVLAKNAISTCAWVLAVPATLALCFAVTSLPTAHLHKWSLDDCAWTALLMFVVSVAFGAGAYFVKKHRESFGYASSLLFLQYLLFAVVTIEQGKAELRQGDGWWKASSALVQAAILPAYGTVLLVKLALALAGIALVGWCLRKLPGAIKDGARYICKAGSHS